MATILVVDDRPSNREYLVTLLGYGGHRSLEASDGVEALKITQAEHPDLIIADILMPTMDGYEFVRQLRAEPAFTQTPVIFLTASYLTREARALAQACGVPLVLTKPVEPQTLLDSVKAALGAPAAPPALPPGEAFEREHLRLMTNTLAKKAEELERLSHQHELILNAVGEGIYGLDLEGRATFVNPAAATMLGYTVEELLGQPMHDLIHHTRPDGRPYPRETSPIYAAFRDGQARQATDEFFWRKDATALPVEYMSTPLRDDDRLVGAVVTFRDITERQRAEERIQRQLQHLNALRAIDIAITASLDLRLTLNVVLIQVTAQLRVDAATVLMLNPRTQTLEYAAGRGFRGKRIEHTRLRLGEGYAGRAALERRVVSVPNLVVEEAREAREQGSRGEAPLLPGPSPPLRESLAGEGFVTAYAVPLIAKGHVKGVLEVFQRAPLSPEHEWLDFFETLAGQAAIAIDNAELFDGLQRSNLDLVRAYDTTLEGWSRALDLRDKETEGHTQRVAEMTWALARAMGLSEVELVHVHRGALLHDIGKMGIPDAILLKPGKLTDEEWEIMRKHPVYAYQLLSPIVYLRPALDIPYCHHEKWDGTGYPRGLKGEQIPLAARLFAVVDVWDALRSERPYRAGWPEEKVLEHIRSLAGTHFDPQAVEAFLREIQSQ